MYFYSGAPMHVLSGVDSEVFTLIMRRHKTINQTQIAA